MKVVNNIGLFNFAVISIFAGAAIFIGVEKLLEKLCSKGYVDFDPNGELPYIEIIIDETDLSWYTRAEIKTILKNIKTPEDIIRYKSSKLGYRDV